jgi:hypothetical protein
MERFDSRPTRAGDAKIALGRMLFDRRSHLG